MNTINKILLSIPSLLGLSYLFTFLFPENFHWLVPTMKAYYIQLSSLQALMLIQFIILIRKLWSFKHVEKAVKKDWTWILIIFNAISCLIFIWHRMDQLEELNNINLSNKND